LPLGLASTEGLGSTFDGMQVDLNLEDATASRTKGESFAEAATLSVYWPVVKQSNCIIALAIAAIETSTDGDQEIKLSARTC
jgi:hypothetical protein